jgi:predicted dehydrogenase/sugar phosphate isomerase/epimerase
MYISIFADGTQLEVKEALPIIKSWGMEYVDIRERINGKEVHNASAEELGEIKKQADNLGLKIAAIESYLGKIHMPNPEELKIEYQKLDGIIRAADILDCHLVRSFFFWQPGHGETKEQYGNLSKLPDEQKKLAELFGPIAQKARDAGLTLAFENCGATCDDVFAFLDVLNISEFGLCWDVNQDLALIRKKNYADFFKKCLAKTVLMHVKGRGILPELEGFKVPWDRVLRGLLAMRKDIPVSIETSNPKNSPFTGVECSKKIYETLQTVWPFAVPESVDAAVAEAEESDYPPCLYADNPVTYVVVGLGKGRDRVNEILKTPGTKLLGVCDTNLAKAKEVGEQAGVPYGNDINVFLNDPKVEVMYVVTPTGLHCSVAEQCLRAGKHVLTTKPMDVNAEHCLRAIRLAKEKGLLLGVDFDIRHRPQMTELVEAVKRGWFGKVQNVYCNLYINRTQGYYDENGGWRGTWNLDGGGSMCNQGVHEVDRVVVAFGMPKRVRAGMAIETHKIETEDHGWSEWDYGNGMVVRYSATTAYPLPTWYLRIEAHGTEGAYICTSGGPEGAHTWWGKPNGDWVSEAPYPQKKRWRQGSDNFANSVRTGEPLSIDGEEGIKSVLVLDAIYESARNGRNWVDVKCPVV